MAVAQGAAPRPSPVPLWLAEVLLLGYVTATLLTRGRPYWAEAVTVGDLLCITGALWLRNGPPSAYALLYYLPTLHAALRLGPREAVGTAGVAAGLYLLVLLHADTLRAAPAQVANLLVPSLLLVALLGLLRREVARGDRLRRLAVTDHLTGLPNRGEIERRLRVALEAAKRHGRPVTVMLLDCDRLKLANDQCGHACGDAVLKALARVLLACLRAYDSAGRLSGDEFLVVLPEVQAEQGVAAAGRIRSLFAKELARLGAPDGVGLSIGLAATEAGQESSPGLVRQADSALYQAKRRGRQQVVVFGEDAPAERRDAR